MPVQALVIVVMLGHVRGFEGEFQLKIGRVFYLVGPEAKRHLQRGIFESAVNGLEHLVRALEVGVLKDDRIMGTSFHPELTNDSRMHQIFLQLCSKNSKD